MRALPRPLRGRLVRRVRPAESDGFTLIELLVVMIVIGILASIAVPVFMTQRRKAVEASVRSDTRSIVGVVEGVNAAGDGATISLLSSPGRYTVTGTDGNRQPVNEAGRLSPGNSASLRYVSTSEYCIQVRNSDTSVAVWTFTEAGILEVGRC